MQRLVYAVAIAAVIMGIVFFAGTSRIRAEKAKTRKATSVPMAHKSLPGIEKILKIEKKFSITDGNSYYTFQSDGTFVSGPMDAFGRTIEGRWQTSGFQDFTITGEWGWINGISAINDRRQMKMMIFPPSGIYPRDDNPSMVPGKLYTAYFVIEEITRIPELPHR